MVRITPAIGSPSCSSPFRVLFLTLGPNLRGPLPKLAPLLISSLENAGVQITRIDWGRHSEYETLLEKAVGRLADIGRVLHALVRNRPEILYVATTLDETALARDIPLLLLSHWSPAKKVVMMHGSKTRPLFEPGHTLYRLMTRLLVRLSDAVLLLSSEEIQKWGCFCPNGRYYRVDNPFISAAVMAPGAHVHAPSRESPFTLLFVGRLINEKGIFELLDAMSIILKQLDCRLQIAGDGEQRAAILDRIRSANLTKSISLLGYLDGGQLSQAYQRASALVLPSYREGFPSSITEAMSFGLPIVTTAVGGIPDHLLPEVNALYIPIGDPEAIARAVLRLAADPILCERMGRANLAKIRDFAPEQVAPQYLAVFRDLLALNLAGGAS